MDVPWLQLGVYAQPLVWILLFDKKLRFPIWLFDVMGVIVAAGVYLSGLNYGFYTNTLLIFYILSVTAVAHHYRDRPNLESVCLGFLIVFVNSFFWEFPIHVADFLEFDSFGVVAVQALHLWPLPFLLKLGFSVPKRWWYGSAVAWTAIAALEVLYIQHVLPLEALYLCRAIGLYTLLWVLQFPGYGSKLIFRVKDKVFRGLGYAKAG
jgi:hypothetical protein